MRRQQGASRCKRSRCNSNFKRNNRRVEEEAVQRPLEDEEKKNGGRGGTMDDREVERQGMGKARMEETRVARGRYEENAKKDQRRDWRQRRRSAASTRKMEERKRKQGQDGEK